MSLEKQARHTPASSRWRLERIVPNRQPQRSHSNLRTICTASQYFKKLAHRVGHYVKKAGAALAFVEIALTDEIFLCVACNLCWCTRVYVVPRYAAPVALLQLAMYIRPLVIPHYLRHLVIPHVIREGSARSKVL